MLTFKEHLFAYANRELELAGFNQTEFGKTVLKMLEDLADLTHNNPQTMKQLCLLLPRLINREPLTAITEDDFEVETHSQGDRSVEISRCTRYPYIYKSIDGKYWNDRAVAFKFKNSPETDLMFLYRPNGSKREITLPYYLTTDVEEIDQSQI